MVLMAKVRFHHRWDRRIRVGLAVLAMAACAQKDTLGGDDPGLASVTVTPDAVTLYEGEADSLSAVVRDPSGLVVNGASVSWASSDEAVAEVGSNGAVTAISQGEAVVTAASGGESDSAVITVVRVPVKSLTVSPDTAILAPGRSVLLTAIPRDSVGGAMLERIVTWSSSAPNVAAVDDSGLVVGSAVGNATITAVSEAVSGTAAITVAEANPSAVDTVFYDGFEGGVLSSWDDIYQTQSGNYSVIEDDTLAFEGTRLMRIFNPAGRPGAGAASHFLSAGDRLYARIRLRYPSSWEGGTKIMILRGSTSQWGSFGVAGVCPDGTDFFLAAATAKPNGNPGALRFYSFFVDMASYTNSSGDPACSGNSGLAGEDPSPGPTPLATYYDDSFTFAHDVWHTLELEVQLNVVGQADGWQRMWADGTLVAEWIGVRWRTASDVVFNAFTLENSAEVSSHDRVIYVDDVLVTTSRP